MSTSGFGAGGASSTARPATASAASTPMVEVVEDLLRSVSSARLVLDTTDADEARLRRDRVKMQVENHLLPRLREVSAPAIVVFGGSTGAGKSTLVNSVVGREVSPSGVLRPTTREPVLVVHPKDAELLENHPVRKVATLVLDEDMTRGLALVDAPDLDSVHAGNRELADRLVELADMWVFVTTGARYGDALPWQRLRDASDRGISLAVVLNRVDRSGLVPIRRDLFDRMQTQGLTSVPFFVIPDVGPLEGFLTPERVRELGGFLDVLGAGAQSRSVIARTVRGAWPALREDVQLLAAHLETQRRTALSLQGSVQAATRAAATQARQDIRTGAAALGAPTTAWLAGASSGGALSSLVAKPRGLFGARRARKAVTGRAAALASLRELGLAELRNVLLDAGATAERGIRTELTQTGAGSQLEGRVTAVESRRARDERLEVLFREWDSTAAARTEDLRPAEDLQAVELRHLVEVGAVGIDGAARAVQRLAGDAGTEAMTSLREELADWAAVAVAGEAESFQASLGRMDVDSPDAATGLRLRASELRGYA